MMKQMLVVSLLLCLFGCGSLSKGPRNNYEFSLTIENASDYVVVASISYDDVSVEDECSKSSGADTADVAPGDTRTLTISTLCHQKPTSKASVTFPSESGIAGGSFSADQTLVCSNSGCRSR